jgi:hypothetical protein
LNLICKTLLLTRCHLIQLTKAVSVYSDAFAWANFRFDSIFRFKEKSCAAKHLQPFFSITGTFISTLTASFLVRTLLGSASSYFHSVVSGERASKSLPGFAIGDHEFHIMKASHLGLCQAAGFALSSALDSSCSCGWLQPALWTLLICWLFALPLGLIGFVMIRISKSIQRKTVKYKKPAGAASWSFYFSKVQSASGSAEYFCRPPVFHSLIRFALGSTGTVCMLMGIRAGTAQNPAESGILFGAGAALSWLASRLSCSVGRHVVVMITNIFAGLIGKKYTIQSGGSILVEDRPASKIACGLVMLLSLLGTLLAKFEEATNHDNVGRLRNRGKWVKKDSLKAFYSEYSKWGILFSVFTMLKNFANGILLSSVLFDSIPLVKVQNNCSKILICY